MGRYVGTGSYRYEVVRGWPKVEIRGVAADVACDSRGRAYVAVRDPLPDGRPATIFPNSGHVLVLDADGGLLATWDEQFSSPHGIWINRDDEVFLADTGLHTVSKHAPSGEVLMTLGIRGEPGAPGAPFNMPTRAKQAPNGDLFVADGYGQNRVHRFSARGEHILSWGGGDAVFLPEVLGQPTDGLRGTGPGEFDLPHDVLVDRHCRVYVLDRENHRWQVFTMLGELVSMCTGVYRPNDMVQDDDDVLHIVSGRGVELRRPDGALIGRWGEAGSAPGQFANGPHGVWLDAQGALYVAEVGGFNRLQKFARVG